ncbi:Lyzozyme M1 (1,4-beta-N-acetylmuramidase), GH25 family [Amycolatopsis xylanica]|uniref:Lysozyme n=1 Tax=Amycolatopsis xylanica TaxID=589385 RepID=A0A1H2ZUK9_9PSEU|nr:lysozyme [Amycolatopsis xylanica]SDX21272.1 Lyzozyme M1 (1,4-beta-N-acetylmuramidase), GH25 family [Amycolatopsis xylanica]
MVECKRKLTAILGAGMLLWGQTSPAAATTLDPYAGAEDNYAGSQIALHEGVDGVPHYDVAEDQVLGHDVSGHQGDVDWPAAVGGGARFVYIKATEGTGFRNPRFAQQYNGSYQNGMIRGSYHFARPDVSSGAEQANYFIANGGGWSGDGKTLPGALDAEYNPYGETCYNKSGPDMVAWIKDFSETYRNRTGRYPTIYTSTNWWKRCTGNSAEFRFNPLWIARYNTFIGELPASWTVHTIWQFQAAGPLPGDQNWFNGTFDRVQALSYG